MAGAAPRAAKPSRVPLYGARPVRHHRVQWLLVDGDSVRRFAVDDGRRGSAEAAGIGHRHGSDPDRKSTRLIQSLMRISYAVFCLKKKIKKKKQIVTL